MRIELIRHGATVYGEEKRYCGRSDVELSVKGRAVLGLADHIPDVIYTSDALRARQTAKIIFPGEGHVSVPELGEMDFGEFEGRTYEELKDEANYSAWLDSGCEEKCPGGESKSEFTDRVCNAFERIVEECYESGKKDIAIVAHGGTQMAILSRFCDENREYYSCQTQYGEGYVLSCKWIGKPLLHVDGMIIYHQ